MLTLRRSARQQARRNNAFSNENKPPLLCFPKDSEKPRKASKRAATLDLDPDDDASHPQKKIPKLINEDTSSSKEEDNDDDDDTTDCLSRTLELRYRSRGYSAVMGIDEAGRGPLAGPVVAAAAVVPHNVHGIVDSKQIAREDERERLHEEIVKSPGVLWAVAVMDAKRIDEINILQATMEGMRLAAEAVMDPPQDCANTACVSRQGCYVVCGSRRGQGTQQEEEPELLSSKKWFALVDGNRLPKDMPCEAESLVKGDSKEYAIAAASILAKVTRDRLMRGYDKMFPLYNLAQHKGYPTAAHMALVKQHGASPIHRRSFAPLKHMTLDEAGRIIPVEEKEETNY